ncbi:Na/Pi cotransporter family protein [Rhodoferax sp.]|uniref:Na/Pi cotransporter family protein n=1 Tax=Rhodoferax sp. TaxID=50421 RepID=UPI00260786A6|nr:Na/Pi cotransporter family protein [Rhodoferax sp.]MDD2926291.1 Na/Pi cotransporter family protein [Rhodoferax sp.]
MTHLLNLLAAIALLVWGTHLVRKDTLRVLGANLRQILARSVGNRIKALLSGVGVTALLQSSTATALIISAFVGQGLMVLSSALAVMLGADLGTSLMAMLFSRDLSWLSPLFIFVGVVLFIARQSTTVGYTGRILIGLGLMLLALSLVRVSANELTRAEAVRALLASLGSDRLLEITVGAVLSVLSYSSLAIVLLIATLAGSQVVTVDVALGLVLGANLGSGLLAVLTTLRSPIEARQVPLGNLIFKLMGVALMVPLMDFWTRQLHASVADVATMVVLFHFVFNALVCVLFIGLTDAVARWVNYWLPKPVSTNLNGRQRHLDPSALATPSVALACAVREAMHQSDVVETMLRGVLDVIKTNDQALAQSLQKMDDTVDALYSDIKYYLTKISREALNDKEGRRWTDIISFTINMEQIGDIVERILEDIETKKIKTGREFSQAGMAEITELHGYLVANLRLGMSVFLNDDPRDALKLLEEKTRFRDLELQYAANHLNRLTDNTLQSIETSSLHLDLISELKRVNSLICSIAYPILESAGALAPNRLRQHVSPADATDKQADLKTEAVIAAQTLSNK